ncbi:Major Facilitator Superfamily protein [Streptomyces sp. TLI_053]|uniref:MFS transporter n=1 Tax=Streptomyces sp. TLI_053 TaxID=1855352 RepID=UPI00087D0314|nr:MFS transporter [Streptomyces sp. TLI_053]SDT82542.1 Major Facilitator Superfamily protein [Streptomyces sp. TLI_053]
MTPARTQRLTLVGSVLGAAVVALDGTVLTVAQPSLRRDLDTSLAAVQWTSTAYLVTVAALLVFAGRLGDRFGHRRVFAVGAIAFGATSAGIGLAPGIGWVIGLRVLQGVAGALLQPATLGLLRAVYPAELLARPIAWRTSAIGLSAAAGPLIGGALTDRLGWRSVFFLTVVPAAVAGVSALLVRLPPSAAGASADRPTGADGAAPAPSAGLDLPGAGLLGGALAALVFTLAEVPEHGPSPAVWLGLAAATALGTAFLRHERRTRHPLLPPTVLRAPTVAPALGVLLTASAALFGSLFLVTYFLQDELALDPLACALRALPLALAMVLAAPLSAVLGRRYGPRRTVVAGMSSLTLGVLLASGFRPDTPVLVTGAAFLLLGAGFGAVMATATTAVVRAAPPGAAGVAGGLQQTAMNIGPALGVAAATTLAAGRPPAEALTTALVVLAVVAATGVLFATRLPNSTTPAGAAAVPASAHRGRWR